MWDSRCLQSSHSPGTGECESSLSRSNYENFYFDLNKFEEIISNNENNYMWFCVCSHTCTSYICNLNVDKNIKNGRTCLDSISRGKWERYYVESNSKDDIIPDHVGGEVSSEYTICISYLFLFNLCLCGTENTASNIILEPVYNV